MEIALRNVLLGSSSLVALVAQRVVWNEIPQGSADPNVSLFNVVPGVSYTYSGPTSLKGALVQINVRALSFASAVAVRDAIEARLSGFRGTQGATVFGGIFLRDTRSSKEKPASVEYHVMQMDFDIWHRPA